MKTITTKARGFHDLTDGKFCILAANTSLPVIRKTKRGNYVCQVSKNAWGETVTANVIIQKENAGANA